MPTQLVPDKRVENSHLRDGTRDNECRIAVFISMKTITYEVRKVSGAPARVLKRGTPPTMLPVPAAVRQRLKMEAWREKFWRSRHKYLILLDPQYREIMRKSAWSMEKAGFPEMCVHFQRGLLCIWFFTGSIEKMVRFIRAVSGGRVFLMNHKMFLRNETPTGLPKHELIQRFLLYDPTWHNDGYSVEFGPDPTLFTSFLGAVPDQRPWLRELASEMEDLRSQAAAELGEDAAKSLWDKSSALSVE
jgi:hypothetical protein